MTAPPLWDHQRAALEHLAADQRTEIVIPMGGGKTRVVCEHLQTVWPLRVLVLCPAAVVSTWVREVGQWAPRYTAHPLTGTVRDRWLTMRSIHPWADGPVAITNYDVVWREEMRGAIRDFAPNVVVLDEAHRIKAPTGRISKTLRRLCKPLSVPSVIELTGTPMPHSPLDVWAQGALTKPEVFGPSFPAFRARYAVLGGPQNNWVMHLRIQRTLAGGKPNPDYDAGLAAEFAERFRRLAFIVTPEEVAAARRKVGNPVPEPLPATFRTHPLPLAARKAYDELDADFVTWVDVADRVYEEAPDAAEFFGERHEATAQNALVKLLRLAQLASGELTADDGTPLTHDERVLAFTDLLEDIPPSEPVVVFCRFLHELADVATFSERGAKRVYAELSGRRRDALDDQGRLAEGVQVAGVQIQAGGVGIDFSRAAHVVFYGHTYSLGDYDQCIARLVRPGQRRAVSVTHLLAENTRDQAVYEALTNRRDVVSDVIESARAVRA